MQNSTHSFPLESWFSLAPKVDLHCHLDGSIRIKTLLELAKEQGITLPTDDEKALFSLVYAGEKVSSLVEYLRGFDITLKVLQTESALTRVTRELIEDCALENVHYVEIRFAPILHQNQGLSLEKIVESVLRGVQISCNQYPIQAKIILCALRSLPTETSLETAKLAVHYKNQGVVGFDLAGDEYNYPPSLHSVAFDYARKHFLATTIHAGEAAGRDSIWQALFHCGAHRIGHGTRLYEDPELEAYVQDFQIPLECCLLSNTQTKAVSTMKEHPAKQYFDKGLCVTLNTDNRLITHTSMTKEFKLAHQELGFSIKDLQIITLNSVKAAFLPHQEKQLLTLKIKNAFEMIQNPS